MNILTIQLLNLPGYEFIKMSGLDPLRIYIKQRKRNRCVECHSKSVVIKESKERKVRHTNFGHRRVYLFLRTHKYQCKECNKIFWERFPGLLPYRRSTQSFRKQIARTALGGMTRKQTAHEYYLGEASVYRYFREELLLKLKEYQYELPTIIGIDEHFFTKKQGYATTICDLAKHRVYDVVLGRTEKALESYLLKLKGRDRVKVVCIDLCSTYRSIIKKYFPKALIVADRFHVIRIINHHFLKTWNSIDPEGKKNRGLLSLMRRHEENLTPAQKITLNNYLNKYPGLKSIYDFKQKLARLMLRKRQSKRRCREWYIPQFLELIDQLKKSHFDFLVTLGNTLDNWAEEIVRMWRFTKNNGITEGFHNKMEMLSRRAFGFRNFENYRIWVKILCH